MVTGSFATIFSQQTMNILMFVYNPFTNDPRVYNEAKSLIQAGHTVTVIAFDRDKQNPQLETWDGIEVVRLRTRISPIQVFGWPLWNSFVMLLWQWQAYHQALVLHKKSCFQVVHCHDFDTLLAGTWLKSKLGLPLIYDAHEIYGYALVRSLPRWIANIFLWFEKRMIKKVDSIITVTEAVKKYFGWITDKPISVVMNCKPLESLKYQPPKNHDKFTLVYIGLLHERRGVPQLIRAIGELPDVQCVIGGIGWPSYVQTIKEECENYPNITFLGKVPIHEVLPLTKKADCSFLMSNPIHPYSSVGFGNKQFEAMVCGRPIICTKGSYAGELTELEEVGLTVEYTEEALKQAIIKLRDDPKLRGRLGRNALRAAISKYNWENQEKKLLALYESIGLELGEKLTA